jgi:hypothetical protein
MDHWEYRFIDLYRGTATDASTAFNSFVAEVRQAGKEGWESVGEVDVAYNPKGTVTSHTVSVRVLILKRPVS